MPQSPRFKGKKPEASGRAKLKGSNKEIKVNLFESSEWSCGSAIINLYNLGLGAGQITKQLSKEGFVLNSGRVSKVLSELIKQGEIKSKEKKQSAKPESKTWLQLMQENQELIKEMFFEEKSNPEIVKELNRRGVPIEVKMFAKLLSKILGTD